MEKERFVAAQQELVEGEAVLGAVLRQDKSRNASAKPPTAVTAATV